MEDTPIYPKTPVTLAEAAAAQQPKPTATPSAQPSQVSAAEPVSPPAPLGSPKTHSGAMAGKNILMLITAVLALGILIFGYLYVRSSAPAPVEQPASISPTTLPSPTPQPNLSRISTTSAFISFSQDIASFSAVLNSFALQDASLVPPILDIELELKN